MKKKNMLKKNQDIQQVLKYGTVYKSNCLIMYVLANKTDKNYVAFLAGKKLGKAPIRNHAKRIMRLVMQQQWDKIKKGFHIVVLARPFVITENREKIEKDLEYLLKKHKIVNDEKK